MVKVFLNSENSKTFNLHRLVLNLIDKRNLKRGDKYIALSYLSIYYKWKNMKKSYKNKFELPDGSYSTFDIKDYFMSVLSKHIKQSQKILQFRYIFTKLKIEIHLKSTLDIF